MKVASLLLVIFLLVSGSSASEPYQFSVNEGDNLQYKVDSGTSSGTFNVIITVIDVSQTEPVNIGPQIFYNIQGEITGEKAQTSLNNHFGWDKLVYANGQNYSVSTIQNSGSLYLASYDDIYPLIWPIATNFYQNWVNEHENIKLFEDGNNMKLVEEIDSTPVDGCLCSTTIEIRDGIATQITQNETYFFTPSGHPENKYRKISLLSPLPEFVKLGDSMQIPLFFATSLLVISITKRSRKGSLF